MAAAPTAARHEVNATMKRCPPVIGTPCSCAMKITCQQAPNPHTRTHTRLPVSGTHAHRDAGEHARSGERAKDHLCGHWRCGEK
eukprot:2716611-Rhodomonas_salina.6